MKKLLSVIIAATFAATGFNAIAQSKPVDTKGGGTVTSKEGTAVGRKEPKPEPKGGPVPKMAKPAKKEKPQHTEVKTKSGGKVTTKDKMDVKSTK